LIKLILITLFITLIPVAGCGFYDSGKEILVDKPLDSSKKRQKLLDTRERVERTKRDYENCLKKNPADESVCENYKRSYEKEVETYSSLQSQ